MVEAQLWDRLKNIKFEDKLAIGDLALTDAVQMLDYSVYFDLSNIPVPSDVDGISHYLIQEGILSKQANGMYAVTNLGAILFAKNRLFVLYNITGITGY